MKQKLPELLAPAGTLAGLKTAVLYGADAVYAGVPGASLRARAKMTAEETKQGIEFAHAHGKKVYLAFNLFAHDRDYADLPRVRDVIAELGPDALIVSDPGIMMWVKQNFPDMPIHISTQTNICSRGAVKFWQDAGASLCVLAREVSHDEFKNIRAECPDMGLEIFVHGAMCMSYSGRCLLSNFMTGRPANRGACAQLCRWNYDVVLRERQSGAEMLLTESDRGAYIMNSRDLCLMPVLDQVLAARPDALKIEGRNRSEYYVGSVVRAYRHAMDAWAGDPEKFDPSPYMDALNVLETRGYTTAFFDGMVGPGAHDYETTRSSSDYHAAGVVTNITDEYVIMELRNEIRAGDVITVIPPHVANNLEIKLSEIINDKDGMIMPKMSAGQGSSLRIPRELFGDAIECITPLTLAYKRKSPQVKS